MKFAEFIQIIKLLPQSRVHLKKVIKQLNENKQGYEKILNENTQITKQTLSVFCIVKSYFWACRLVNNCQCLPRSIALYQQLKIAGFEEIEHKFGVNKTEKSFSAHAWVEYKNQPLNESADLLTKFTVLKKD